MAKSDLQIRAERAAELLGVDARNPIVIEFAGLPKAGKTTTISRLQGFLKRCGFRVEVVVERASVCPIRDKKHSNFNVWTACTTLSQILEKTQNPPRSDDPNILILDRGLFDSISWLTMMERLSRIQSKDRKNIEDFLLIEDWRKRITGVILMTSSPEDAMEREKGYPPVENAKGSIMNLEVLQQMLRTTTDTAERLKHLFPIHVQALPVAVVRNKSGEILRLRRREKSDENALHRQAVLWAGGHVRKEDGSEGDALAHCVIRELQEELRLSIESHALNLLGAVYFDDGGSIAKHVAIVYEWRAATDDVVVALSSSEFFERRGTSMSGKFTRLEEIAHEVEIKGITETWSAEIIRNLFTTEITPRLL